MKLTRECSIIDFEPWSGAIDTKETIINANKADAFDSYIEECYPDGLTETELNDILWFDSKEIFNYLGIESD